MSPFLVRLALLSACVRFENVMKTLFDSVQQLLLFTSAAILASLFSSVISSVLITSIWLIISCICELKVLKWNESKSCIAVIFSIESLRSSLRSSSFENISSILALMSSSESSSPLPSRSSVNSFRTGVRNFPPGTNSSMPVKIISIPRSLAFSSSFSFCAAIVVFAVSVLSADAAIEAAVVIIIAAARIAAIFFVIVFVFFIVILLSVLCLCCLFCGFSFSLI